MRYNTTMVIDDLPPSKTQRKREAHALTDLGEQLTNLSNDQLAELPLENDLREAIEVARKLRPGGARKRQLQYIGKRLRQTDVEPLRKTLEQWRTQSNLHTQAFQRIEQWRDRLIAEGDDAVNALMADYPDADRPFLRQTLRKAQQEQAKEQSPQAARRLFKYLRDLLDAP